MGRLTPLAEKAAELGIRPPTKRTLDRYGISSEDWLRIMERQGWKCPICEQRKPLWNIDHEHVPGWAKRPPHERRRYVRGILCSRCNWWVVGGNLRRSAEAFRIAKYLLDYEQRRDAP